MARRVCQVLPNAPGGLLLDRIGDTDWYYSGKRFGSNTKSCYLCRRNRYEGRSWEPRREVKARRMIERSGKRSASAIYCRSGGPDVAGARFLVFVVCSRFVAL